MSIDEWTSIMTKQLQHKFKSRLAWLVLLNYRQMILAEIWKTNGRLARSVCHRHWLPVDVSSEVLLRLHTIIRRFDGDCRISTVVRKGVRWSLLAMCRELEVMQKRDAKIGNACFVDNEVESDAVDAASRGELAETVADCLRFLTTRERTIIETRCMQGNTLGDVGKKLSMTKERVRQIESRAIRIIRNGQLGERLLPFVGLGEKFSKSEEDEI